MGMNHTPGPWRLSKSKFVWARIPRTERNRPIAVVDFEWPNGGSNEANATLITAAPELLEAVTGHEDPTLWRVNWVAGMIKQYEREHDWDEDEDADATRMMLETVKIFCELTWAAIAKATGDKMEVG